MIKMVLLYMIQVKKNFIGKKVKYIGKISIILQKKKSEFYFNYIIKI